MKTENAKFRSMILGTILPDAETERLSTLHENARLQNANAIGNGKYGKDCARVVGGERRWYFTSDKYAIVGRDNRIRVFAESIGTDGREVSQFHSWG